MIFLLLLLIGILNVVRQDCKPSGPFFRRFLPFFFPLFLLIFHLFWGFGGVYCRIPVCLMVQSSSGTGSADGPMEAGPDVEVSRVGSHALREQEAAGRQQPRERSTTAVVFGHHRVEILQFLRAWGGCGPVQYSRSVTMPGMGTGYLPFFNCTGAGESQVKLSMPGANSCSLLSISS